MKREWKGMRAKRKGDLTENKTPTRKKTVIQKEMRMREEKAKGNRMEIEKTARDRKQNAEKDLGKKEKETAERIDRKRGNVTVKLEEFRLKKTVGKLREMPPQGGLRGAAAFSLRMR